MRALAAAACLMLGCGRLGFASVPDASGNGGDGGTNGDGNADAPAMPVGACPTTVALADDFSASTAGTQWTVLSGNGLTVSQGSGVLKIVYANNVPASQTAGYQSSSMFDFTGACVTVELVMIPNKTTVATAKLAIGTGTTLVYVEEFDNFLQSFVQVGNMLSRLEKITYDPIAHRYLRLREQNGTWFSEASSDGVTFATLGSSTLAGVPVTNVVSLTANTGVAVNSGGEAEFGPFSVLVPP